MAAAGVFIYYFAILLIVLNRIQFCNLRNKLGSRMWRGVIRTDNSGSLIAAKGRQCLKTPWFIASHPIGW